jgi:hypothetical protein
MHVMRAGCSREGTPGVMEQRAPLDDERATYGIWPSPRLEWLVGHYLRTLAFGSGQR